MRKCRKMSAADFIEPTNLHPCILQLLKTLLLAIKKLYIVKMQSHKVCLKK